MDAEKFSVSSNTETKHALATEKLDSKVQTKSTQIKLESVMRFPPVETFKQVRQTKVEPNNKVLWPLVTTLQNFFAHLLRKMAMPSNILQKCLSDEKILHSLCIFKCAHDTFHDSGARRAPHLVANFTEAIKQMAGVVAKHRMQDSEKQEYELITQSSKKQLITAEKAFATASNKIKTVVDKAVECNEKEAVKKKRSKLLVDAQNMAADAKLALNETNKVAAEASKKAAMVLDIQTDIIQQLKDTITQMKQAPLFVGDETLPACIESCEIYLEPWAAGQKSSNSTCTDIQREFMHATYSSCVYLSISCVLVFHKCRREQDVGIGLLDGGAFQSSM